MGLRDPVYLLIRDLVNVILENIILGEDNIQTLISIWTYNPIILGLNIGELEG